MQPRLPKIKKSMRWIIPLSYICAPLLPLLPTLHGVNYAEAPDFADFRKSGTIVQGYSHNRENKTYGVTIQLRQNKVRSLAAGRVHSKGTLRGYGNFVIIDHGQGWHSLYSHLARFTADKGAFVAKGTMLGEAKHKRLFLVVSYRGNPINPSEVMREKHRAQSVAFLAEPARTYYR